jgi:hypothetical protein
LIKIVKNPGNGRLNNLNDLVLNVPRSQNTGIFTDTAVRTNLTIRTSCLYSPLKGAAVLKFKE